MVAFTVRLDCSKYLAAYLRLAAGRAPRPSPAACGAQKAGPHSAHSFTLTARPVVSNAAYPIQPRRLTQPRASCSQLLLYTCVYGPVLLRDSLQTQLGFVNFWEVSLTFTTMGSAVVRYLLLTSNGRQFWRADAEGWASLDPAQVRCGARSAVQQQAGNGMRLTGHTHGQSCWNA